MHRRLVVGLTAALVMTSLLAVDGPSQAASGCIPSPNAPAEMNQIPAFSGCEPQPSGTAKTAAAAAAPATVVASTPIGARLPFAKTNGDILAITKVRGATRPLIAFGGNFTAVITPDGISRPAKNFAVVDENTGALVYAGNANSYVRAISSWNGTVYIGGDFTVFAGSSRARIVALSPSFTVATWNPSSSGRVRAILAGPLGIYVGGDTTSARLISRTGSTLWSQPVVDGAVRSFALSPDGGRLYVGGLFESYGGLLRHGLVKASPSTGAVDSAFNANLRVDSTTGVHAGFDGEAAVAMEITPDGKRVVTGIAGYGSDQLKIFNATTGALIWVKVIPGDGQAVGVVGSTYVVGYHRNRVNGTIPYPYFVAQLEASNAQLTDWDPRLEGNQGNADGGNNGVQAIYVDAPNGRLFVAGAFTTAAGQPLYSLAVYPFAPQGNQAPTASFTTAASGAVRSFDGSSSFDPDGSITSYAWTFGDGSSGTGATTTHTYADPGTYQVTLKVTDGGGATATASTQVTIGSTALFASDAFSRTVSGGLGSADVGGAWTTAGTAADFSVAGGAGKLSTRAGGSLSAFLPGASSTDADVRMSLGFDKASTGSGTYAAVIGRRVSSGNDFRLKLRVQPGGAVTAQLVRTAAGVETALATLGTVPGLTWGAGDVVQVRLQVTGTSPTRLAAKVWKSGTAEPSAWLLQTNDSTAGLQTGGSIGLWTYLSGSATTVPMVLSVDDITAGAA